MLLPYWLSVALVSLALYGLWHFCRDLGGLWAAPRGDRPLAVSLLVIVRDAEGTIEGHIRGLLYQTAFQPAWEEVVIADHASADLTLAILARLAAAHPSLKIVSLPAGARPVADAIPFCQGELIQVLDMESRVAPADWEAAILRLRGR